ncbi:glycosyltransferase family 2 protein [Marinilabilia sp.]
MNPKISIVIVTYQPTPVTHLCFWSLEQCQLNNSEVIVVDNSGQSSFIEEFEKLYPFLKIYKNQENEGFGRACNRGFKHAKGEIILFLNPDTIVPSNLEEKVLLFFREHPNAGAMGVKMIDAFGDFLPESKRNFPTPIASLLKFSRLSNLPLPSKKQWHYYADHIPADSPGEVTILSGAFMAVTRPAMEKTGGFDPRFFLYSEDIDLSFEIIQNGFENWYNPDITIIHLKGETALKNMNYPKYFFDSMQAFYQKHYSLKHNSLKKYSATFIIRLFQIFRKLKHKKNLKSNSRRFRQEVTSTEGFSRENVHPSRGKNAQFPETSSDLEAHPLISTNDINPSDLIRLIQKNKGQNKPYLLLHHKSQWLLQLNGKNETSLSYLKTAVK